MNLPAVSVDVRQTCATITVAGNNSQAAALAGLFCLKGQSVRWLTTYGASSLAWCHVSPGKNTGEHAKSRIDSVRTTAQAAEAVTGSEAVIIAAPATEYGSTLIDLGPFLNSSQTVFLPDAPIGAALEVAHLLAQRRTDLAINIVEMGAIFDETEIRNDTVYVKGLRNRITISGRSINETRVGLSLGGSLWDGLVPASNLLERGFCDHTRTAKAVLNLFVLLGCVQPNRDETNFRLPKSVSAIYASLQDELKAVGRAYNVTSVPPISVPNPKVESAEVSNLLMTDTVETLALISAFARVAYVSTPVLDSIIDMSSAATGMDLRKEGRQLSDLGLIGMDVREIIEFVNS